MKRTRIGITSVMFYLLIVLVVGLSFSSSPEINSGSNATTSNNLECAWTSSGDTTETNVSWYQDSNSVFNFSSASSPNIIGSGNTTRGETWNCTVTIYNGTDTLAQSDNIFIENADPNPIQVFNASLVDIGNQTNITEDVAYTFNVTATDPDGDIVTYSSISLPSGASFSSTTGIMTWTPTSSDIGGHTVTFIALDNQTPDKGSTAKDVTFTVVEENDDPAFSPAITNQTATEGVTFTYDITAADEENDFPLLFNISAPTLSNLAINLTSNTTATIYFTTGAPVFSNAGNHTVTVNVTDARNGSAIDTFNLEVIPVNQLPVLSLIANASGTQGVLMTALFNASDNDVNDTLTFSISAVSCAITDPWTVDKLNQASNGTITEANATVNQTITNNHVICPQVNISVTDSKEFDWQLVTFNLTNTNDAPIIGEISPNASNTGGNNISLQQAYTNTAYSYTVNASDIDSLTSGGEVLNFSDNTTLFNISSAGVISFTPTVSDIGNHTINITVEDDEGLRDSRLLNLEVLNNSAPTISNPGNLSCLEDSLCTIFITATEPDGDNVTFTSNNTAIFNLSSFNTTAGIVNTTYLQASVGNYTLTINATDDKGASTSIILTFMVNNTNDAPVLTPLVFPPVIAETKSVLVAVTASDEDISLLGGAETLNFSDNTTLFNISTLFNNATNQSSGLISFTPTLGEAGNYTINISVTDPSGAVDYEVVTIEILNKTNPPNISQVMPYGLPINSSTVQNVFINTSDFNGSTITNITIDENTTVLFNHTTTDDVTALSDLTFTWLEDGVNVSNNYAYSKTFDFFSSGTTNITLIVNDSTLENSTWTWYTTVNNINRAPVLISSLENVTLDSTQNILSYLYLRDAIRYIDPDDDTNSDNVINGSETNSLSFSVTTCSVADIEITNLDVRFTPTSVGSCAVTFTATDPSSSSTISNTVAINVTDVPEGTTTTTTTVITVSSGGGGGSASSVIPIDRDVETPKAFRLVSPSEVTLYQNRTVTVPIYLENTWNSTLKNVQLDAYTNKSEVDISFDIDFFEELETNARQKVLVTVNNYRLGENFEILINASSEEPDASDTVLILMNSIEQADKGDQYRVKVTFARDLLSTNSECNELSELLDKADEETGKGNIDESLRIVDTVINGCKYLVSQNQMVNEEKPKLIEMNFLKKLNWFYIGTGLILVALLVSIVIIELKIRKEKEEVVEE